MTFLTFLTRPGEGPSFPYAGQPPLHVLAGHDGQPAGFAAMEITVPAYFAWRRPRWPGPGRDRPHPVQRAQPAGRVRHQRPPARASDRAIAHQTRHRSLATLDGYVRVHTASADNAATQLGL
jgi:hypothetical protein